MTVAQAVTLRHTFKILWGRAPLWRFSFMSASLCTLLFVLFPPLEQSRTDKTLPTPLSQATYNPPPVQSGVSAQQAVPMTANSLSLNTPDSVADDAIRKETGFDRAVLGRLYSGTLHVDGFDIPLPEGNWAVFASAKMNYPSAVGMGYFLGRVLQKRLAGGVLIYAMRTKQDSLTKGGNKFKWSNLSPLFKSDECAASDDSYIESCWLIYNYFAAGWQQWGDKTLKAEPLMNMAAANIIAKGISYPQDFVASLFVRTEKWAMLMVRYMANPESDNIKSSTVAATSDSDWASENINRYPEKMAYVAKIKKWDTGYWEKLKAAFSAGASFPAPNVPSTVPHPGVPPKLVP